LPLFGELKITGVSGYSYYDAHFIYLEEDCDAELFINAVKARGITDDQIRRWPTNYQEEFVSWRLQPWAGEV